MSIRAQRVEKELQQVLAKKLNKFHFPFDAGLVSLIRVQVTSDLKLAKAFISVFGSELGDEVVKSLQARSSEFQSTIAKEIPMKFCPKVTFVLDKGIDHLLKVGELLDSKTEDDKDPVID